MLQNELHNRLMKSIPNVGVDINIQDQTTQPIIFKLNQVVGETTLASVTAIDDTVVSVVSGTGVIAGQLVTILSAPDNRFYIGTVVSVNVNDITLDTPLDFAFPIGAGFAFRNSNMNANGSVTPQVFSFRGDVVDIPTVIDITRIMFSMICNGVVTYVKFGDLLPLTKGIVLRRKNGTFENIFNVKSNAELDGITHDLKLYAASNPQQGFDGVSSRLTFAGQDKMGVVIRIAAGEDLQLIIQDDLSALLKFEIIVEGHVVE